MALSTVFKSGNSMAVRLLKECALPKGTRIHEYREGKRIIIEPLAENDFPQSFLDTLGAWTENIPLPPRSKPRDFFSGDNT